jgi:hypothetical protein
MTETSEELARLLAGAQEWARRNLGPEDGHFAAAGSCQWCPLCQFVAVLRGDRPELTAQVVEAGAALILALHGLVDALGGAGRPAPDSAAASSRVQHIDLDEH